MSRMSIDQSMQKPTSQMLEGKRRMTGFSRHGASMMVPSIKSLKSLGTLNSSQDHISIYRNEEERQSMMKLIGDQQSNY